MIKNYYFTPSSINQYSRQMYNRLVDLGLSHQDTKYFPTKAALLVLDVQKYFFSEESHAFIPSANAIISNLQKLINYFYLKKRPIYFTKHINDHENAGLMKSWWRDLIVENSEMADLIEEIDINKGILIRKERYDAFWNTNLNESLKRAGIEQVVICGVMTHLCCETTARTAFMHDYQVFFTIDGTASYNDEFHMASILNLSHGFAKAVLCSELT